MLIKIPDTSSFVTATVLNVIISEIESKIPDTSGLVIATVLNIKINEVENKIPTHTKYITTQEIDKLTAENFDAILKQTNLVAKTNFGNKLISSNRGITSN